MTMNFNSIKIAAIILIASAAMWFYKDWEFQKSENIRKTENTQQWVKGDSLKLTSQILTKDELIQYLNFRDKKLLENLKQSGIKAGRIESIVSTNYKYRDTLKKETDLSPILEAIKAKHNLSESFIDTTHCMTIKGNVSFKDDSLKFTITDREFKNKTDAVAYWERQQWSLFGIKTTFLGKKQFTAKVFDQCGESRVMKIEKKE